MTRINGLAGASTIAVLACVSASAVQGAALHDAGSGVMAASELQARTTADRLAPATAQPLPPGVGSSGPSDRSVDDVLVYHNTTPRFFYTADVDGTWVGDDITLDGAARLISEYRVGAYGHGAGPYVVTSNLAYGIDGATAYMIAGSECVFEVPSGAGLVDLFCTLDPPLIVPDSLYALFECDDYENGAWLVSDEAEVGFTEDNWCIEDPRDSEGQPMTPGCGWWFGDPYGGFEWSVRADPDCNDNDIPDEEDIAAGTSEDLNTNGVPDECEQPAILSGRSCRTHGDAGALCMDLAFDAAAADETPKIEPRLGGVARVELDLSFALDEASVSAEHVQLTCQPQPYTGSVTASMSGETTVVLDLDPPMPDGHCCRVTMDGMVSTLGHPVADSLSLATLAGDVSRDGIVNTIDFSGIKSRFGVATDVTNQEYDLNTDGIINSLDSSAVKARFGVGVVTCP